MLYRGLIAALAVVGCASAGSPLEGVDAGRDGNGGGDSSNPDVDAAVDSTTQCTVMMTQLLTNPAFELTPLAMGWTETRINNEPIVRNDGIAGHTPSTKAWLGGLAGGNVSDGLRQDVMVPAGTTELVLTGQYQVRTNESGGTAFDRGTAALVQTDAGETLIQSIVALDNTMAAMTWTAINVTFTTPSAGQTVRLRFTSTNDIFNSSSFYFDSLALTATHCQ